MNNNKTLNSWSLQYEAPTTEAIELAAESVLCNSNSNTIVDLDSRDFGEF